jgi:hypothetical protein
VLKAYGGSRRPHSFTNSYEGLDALAPAHHALHHHSGSVIFSDTSGGSLDLYGDVSGNSKQQPVVDELTLWAQQQRRRLQQQETALMVRAFIHFCFSIKESCFVIQLAANQPFSFLVLIKFNNMVRSSY